MVLKRRKPPPEPETAPPPLESTHDQQLAEVAYTTMKPLVGVDYAFYPHPSLAVLKAAGVKFVMRYTSPDPANDQNGKNLVPAELALIEAAKLDVGLVFESTASRALDGKAAGVADAQHSEGVVNALGMKGLPVYFACDFDATPADQAPINAYLEGVASVIGLDRTGIYAGFYPLQRAFDAKKVHWGWQTYAWSAGQWDTRAQLRQVHNGITYGGVSVDGDLAMTADYGQWPRPAAPPPSGVVLVTGDGKKTLSQVARDHGVTVQQVLWHTAQHKPAGFGNLEAHYISRGRWGDPMPAGTEVWAGK